MQVFEQDSMVVDIWKDTDRIVEDLPVDRKYSFKSGVNIMFGCKQFLQLLHCPLCAGTGEKPQAGGNFKRDRFPGPGRGSKK